MILKEWAKYREVDDVPSDLSSILLGKPPTDKELLTLICDHMLIGVHSLEFEYSEATDDNYSNKRLVKFVRSATDLATKFRPYQFGAMFPEPDLVFFRWIEHNSPKNRISSKYEKIRKILLTSS